MADTPSRRPASPDDPTIPSRPTARKMLGMSFNRLAAYGAANRLNEAGNASPLPAPWALQQYFDAEIDLDAELASRFPNMPLMSLVSFRDAGSKHPMALATLSTQDGAAMVGVQVEQATRVVQFSFTLASMLSLHFRLDTLNDADRAYWLELMRSGSGTLAFLWGQTRWEADYLICVAHKMYTNLYAFSPLQLEAAARCTPEVTRRLLDWLHSLWSEAPPDTSSPQALTW